MLYPICFYCGIPFPFLECSDPSFQLFFYLKHSDPGLRTGPYTTCPPCFESLHGKLEVVPSAGRYDELASDGAPMYRLCFDVTDKGCGLLCCLFNTLNVDKLVAQHNQANQLLSDRVALSKEILQGWRCKRRFQHLLRKTATSDPPSSPREVDIVPAGKDGSGAASD
jgi:hypothetical protein